MDKTGVRTGVSYEAVIPLMVFLIIIVAIVSILTTQKYIQSLNMQTEIPQAQLVAEFIGSMLKGNRTTCA